MTQDNDNKGADALLVITNQDAHGTLSGVRFQRHEEIEQCPQCELMAWEAIEVYGRAPRYLIDGVIDCPECNATVFVKKDSERGSAELLDGDHPDSVASQVRECLAYDAKKGIKGGSSGSSGRKKPKSLVKDPNAMLDDSADWSSEVADGIVSSRTEPVNPFDCRVTVEPRDGCFHQVLCICRWLDIVPSEAFRLAIEEFQGAIASPLPEYETDLSSTKRTDIRMPSSLKDKLKAAAASAGVSLTEAVEDMVLRLYIETKGDKSRWKL